MRTKQSYVAEKAQKPKKGRHTDEEPVPGDLGCRFGVLRSFVDLELLLGEIFVTLKPLSASVPSRSPPPKGLSSPALNKINTRSSL
jgi:hypothetical protein